MYLWLIHMDAWQKATRYCKAIILQLKINNFFKKWSCLSTTSYKCGNILGVVSNSLQSHGLYSPWNSLSQNTGVGSLFPSPGDLPNPGIEPRSPTLQMDSLPAGPQAKPKTTGMGSLSLLQWIFPTQELNRGLLHCRWIHYQLSYQGSLSLFKHKIRIIITPASQSQWEKSTRPC